jgi:RNA-directed DNA polymerase
VSESGRQDKPFVISKQQVWEAYRKVKANKGAAGVDEVSLAGFETDLKNNLFKIWNRMSSGSYFPPPVKAVTMPKPHGGGTRTLGVPTVADRIAQTVVAQTLEPRTESIFVDDSFGYRPGRSALHAVERCRARCLRRNWVLDLDVAQFFDSVPHDLMVKAVAANTDQPWVLLYVKRWLIAPLQHPDGTLQPRDRGTPQGSAVSPVLANLFMHYAFDLFLARQFPGVQFERYADDAVVHCVTERQAREVRDALTHRLAGLGMQLHPDKTRIVYCKDDRRRGAYAHTSFTFLGFTFGPRAVPGRDGGIFTGFLPAVSNAALKEMGRRVRRWRIHRHNTKDLAELVAYINPIVAGWMTYYGRFYRSRLYRLLRRINSYLMRWARQKYKRLRTFKAAHTWWRGLIDREPTLFRHWAWMCDVLPPGG